ncbi:MAG: multiheme c-type cytochrome [bacterium]
MATTQFLACDGQQGMRHNSGNGADIGLDVLPEYDIGHPDVAISGEVSRYLPVTREESHGLATSLVCSDCHATSTSSSAMKDAAGRPIGQFDLWQSTMKANSYRDPFFRAVMSAEVHRNPEAQEAIEQTCLRCHAPAGTVAAERSGTPMSLEAATVQGTVGAHAADGVNCVACHAIMDVNLGTEASYSAGWQLDADKRVFGPHASPFTMPMQNRIGFTPVASDHISSSELCATCHTLHTATFLPEGGIAEEKFPEQTPYLEWKNSIFASGDTEQTCQDCHMPTTDVDGNVISTKLAHKPDGGDFPPVNARSPYGRHLLVGGNIWVPQIFKNERATLGPVGSDAAIDATIVAPLDQLQNRTARVSIEEPVLNAGRASFAVAVENLAGHKFPTAYPSRRAWLHIKVMDAGGATLWESGAYTDAGDIVGDDGGTFPHAQTLNDASQVQVYEAVLGDVDGNQTVALLRAHQYLKDNRLLPKGWRADHEDIGDTQSVGVDGDPTFVGGGDTTLVDAVFEGTPTSIEVELLYQSLGNRWLRDLFDVPTADVQAFKQMWERIDRRPAVVSSVSYP